MEKQINKFHALQLFTDTFTAETVHLTNKAVGIYIRLLSFAWTKNTKPFTTESAFRICQCMDDQCCIDVYEVLEEFFKVDKDCDDRNKKTWIHKRLVKEHQYLSEKYQKRSDAGRKGAEVRHSANGITLTPSPNPNPKPINNKYEYDQDFEQLWSLLKIKRGSKFKAHKFWEKLLNLMPSIEQTATIYNKQMINVDKQYIPHFSTWLNERRWEQIDESEDSVKSITERLVKLGYTHLGRIDNFERFSKDGKKYKIDLFDDKNMIVPDE